MGFKHEYTINNIEREKIYIVQRINLDNWDNEFLQQKNMRAFSSENKAREFCTQLKKQNLHCLIDDDCYSGIYDDGIHKWAYCIESYEIDADFDELCLIGHIPIKPREEKD